MPVSAIQKMNLAIHGQNESVTAVLLAPGSISNAKIASDAQIADTKLDTIATANKVANSATTATDANTANAIVARDANGDFSAGVITATAIDSATLAGAEASPGAITTSYTGSYYLQSATSFNLADLALDAQIAAINAKKTFHAFIDGAAGGETSLSKPVNAPPIPDNDDTEVWIDGRKVRRGTVFTVAADGSQINFMALSADQDVELKYVAYDGANAPSGISLRIGEIAEGTTFTTFQASVAATATQINDPLDTVNRLYAVENLGTSIIYVGSSSAVTTSNGFALHPRDTFQVTLTASGQLWAIAASGTVPVSVIKGH